MNTVKNITKAATLAALSQLPGTGAFLTFYKEFVSAQAQDRRELFEKEVIEQFAKQNIEFEKKLRECSNFASILHSAYIGACTEVEEDKVKLYVTATLNYILNENINNSKVHIFLNILRDSSFAHIDMLERLSTPIEYTMYSHVQQSISQTQRTTKEIVIEKCFSDYPQKELIQIIINDLTQKGLIVDDNFLVNGCDNISNVLPKKTTPLGDEFLEFISDNG